MTICIDIGGGTTRIGFSADKKTFEKIIKFETWDTFEDEIRKIIESIKDYAQDPAEIIIASAGIVDKENGILIRWGQRRQWQGKSFFKPLKDIFKKSKIILENDATVAALGESIYGAGRKYSIVGYLTLSSGIGGGLIIDKKIVPHKWGCEPGDLILNPNGPKGDGNVNGDFEAYASGASFERIFGMRGEECNDPVIWDKYTEYLSMGIANVLFLWSPEVLILGGGISKKFDSFIEPLKKRLRDIHPVQTDIEIVKAELDEPGLHGGLAL